MGKASEGVASVGRCPAGRHACICAAAAGRALSLRARPEPRAAVGGRGQEPPPPGILPSLTPPQLTTRAQLLASFPPSSPPHAHDTGA